MKLYKVDLYKVSYVKSDFSGSRSAIVRSLGKVIVKKQLHSVQEVLTGYPKISIVPRDGVQKYNGSSVFQQLDVSYWNRKKDTKEGAHLFVIAEDLRPQNMVNAEEIGSYVDEYESSHWKKVYEEMKKYTKEEKSKAQQKAKQVMGTMK